MLPYCTVLLCLLASGALAQAAYAVSSEVPLRAGLIFTSALHSAKGDRESVVTVTRADSAGVSYGWKVAQQTSTGELKRASFHRFVRAADLQNATRLNTVFISEDRMQYPGYTAFSFSSGVYDALLANGESPFTVVSENKAPANGAHALLGSVPQTVKLKGKLTVSSREPVPFPLLIDGQRVTVPAIAAQGRFQFQKVMLEQSFLVLADRSHPLVLKVITGSDVYQVIRIDFLPSSDALMAKGRGLPPPARSAQAAPRAGGGGLPAGKGESGEGKSLADSDSSLSNVERALQQNCRAELPGIYFEFARADLTSESQRTLDALARMIQRHADWSLSIEGHTDDIGSVSDNQKLSEARASAVRTSLVEQHRVPALKLTIRGFGEAQPRETNATLEGRARNRRVELVRPCQPDPARGSP